MRIVKRVTADMVPLPMLSGEVLIGEQTLLRIGKSGFTIDYLPLRRAEWRNYPPFEAFTMADLQNTDRSAMFATYDDGVFIGCCTIKCNSLGWAQITDIRVDVSHRRSGVAGMMLDACEHYASQQHMNGLSIRVPEDHPALCQFCQQKHFILQGLDRMALVFSKRERQKPLARRSCALLFYRLIQT